MKVYFVILAPDQQSIYVRLETISATFNDTPDFHIICIKPYICVHSDLIHYIVDEKDKEEGTKYRALGDSTPNWAPVWELSIQYNPLSSVGKILFDKLEHSTINVIVYFKLFKNHIMRDAVKSLFKIKEHYISLQTFI